LANFVQFKRMLMFCLENLGAWTPWALPWLRHWIKYYFLSRRKRRSNL